MEIEPEEIEFPKKSFKISDSLILDCLKVVYNESNSMFLFWNKFQIFGYENHNFEDISKEFVPEFSIDLLFNTNNYLVCLDCTGNVHVTSLKFKNATQKRFRSCFQPREQGILTCVLHTQETLACLKHDGDNYFLSLHKINIEFQLEKKVLLQVGENEVPLPSVSKRNCVLHTHVLRPEQFEQLRDKFSAKNQIWNDSTIVLLSFDKITVYGCLFSAKMPNEQITLTKLYVNVSEICDIKVIVSDNLYVIIGLTIGSLIKLPLTTNKPDVIHLNTAICKLVTTKTNETIFYTDGNSLWKAENTLQKDISYSQFFPKQIKDFILFGDHLMCTTYTNVFYTFRIEDDSVYCVTSSVGQYCAAEKLLSNSEYYYKIMKELEKGGYISKKLHLEGGYLTALALSRRQDIMDQVVSQQISVYEKYEDVINESPDVTLTERLSNYFDPKSILLLVKLTSIMIHHTFNDVLSNLFGDLKVHITVASGTKLLKTVSVKLSDTLTKLDILIPLDSKCVLTGSTLNVEVKIVTNIPGSLDERKRLWTVLYRKHTKLNSEHFVKTTSKPSVSFKEANESIEELILQSAVINHSHLFKFTDVSKNLSPREWNLYVKLPIDFKNNFITGMFKEKFNVQKAKFYVDQLTSEEFINSKAVLIFEIGNEKIKLDIMNYFSRPLLVVISNDLKIASDMRNFISNIINGDYGSCQPGMEYVNYALYTTIDNLKNRLNQCILCGNDSETEELIKQFQRTVYGALPL